MEEDWRAAARLRIAERREREKAEQVADEEKARSATEIAWLCASTDPVRDKYANEMAGRKLHAIPYTRGETSEDIKRRRSVCGRRAKHGWCSDLFNEKCERCLAKAGGDGDESRDTEPQEEGQAGRFGPA
jgi:hypothetical protein